jgi:hypothetical protein
LTTASTAPSACIPIGHYVSHTRPHCALCAGEKTYTSAVFGPTCDSLNTVVTRYQLPLTIDVALRVQEMVNGSDKRPRARLETQLKQY